MRGRMLAAILVVLGAVMLGRLVQLQVFEHSRWSAAASAMQEQTIELPGQRGTIWDINGVALAYDVRASGIAVDGISAVRPSALAQILSEELHLPLSAATGLVTRDSYFTWVDRDVDLETARRIERRMQEAGAYGLVFIDTWQRCYPQNSLGSNVIGFVGVDGYGLEGIELAHDAVLRGTASTIHIVESANGSTVSVETVLEGKRGSDIVLGMDARLQLICEESIDAGVDRFNANAGMMVVLDPNDGRVLAMAQSKRYDLNEYSESTADQRMNLAVAYAFEPGSIFKAFCGVAALEAGVVAPNDVFDGNDGIHVDGHVIHNAEHESYGDVTFSQVIQDSINAGMIQVALQLGKEAYHAYLAAVGFGAATGIELPGEVKGTLRDSSQWTDLDLASSSIGQSVAVTAIQLTAGLATIANGGYRVQPHVIESIDGAAVSSYGLGRQVVSAESCAEMRRMMELVVERGTAVLAALDGLAVAGKSGTAQKAEPGVGYASGKYTSLFAGLFPADNPQYVFLVILDEVGTTPIWGGYTCGQVFHDAASRYLVCEPLPSVASRP